MFAALPSLFYLVAIGFIWKYPITEEYQRRVRGELEARASAQPAE